MPHLQTAINLKCDYRGNIPALWYTITRKHPLNRQPERLDNKRGKLKSFMDYIDICLAENVRNDEVIFAEIKAMVYGPTFHAALLHSART